MNGIDDLDNLISQYLDDRLTPEELERLSTRLASDPVAREAFISTAMTDLGIERLFQNADLEVAAEKLLATLRMRPETWDIASTYESNGHVSQQVELAARPSQLGRDDQRKWTIGWRFAVAASILALLAAAPLINSWNAKPHQAKEKTAAVESASVPLATIGRVQFVGPTEGHPLIAGTTVYSGESIRFEEGLVEVRIHAGANLIMKGPADLEIVAPLRAILHRGTLTAKVEDSALGFRVDTRSAKVVDLGTEFGVSITEAGETDIVVFEGSVEMEAADHSALDDTAASEGQSRLMQSGDGLRVRSGGGISRLVSINSTEFPTALARKSDQNASHLISGVSDNLRENDTVKCYRIVPGGLTDDAPAYVDRDHQWNGVDQRGIPGFLAGADYIMPFNDDKMVDRLAVKVSVARPARIYVFIDNRVPTPVWLTQRFINTGHKIGLDEGDFPNVKKRIRERAGESIDNVCSIWVAEVDGGESLVLGSLGVSEEYTSMYGIAATPLFPTSL